MGKPESKMCQEMGPKKFYEKVEKANKFYDDHKAGKRDPKTGHYYNHINWTDPRKKTKLGSSLCTIECLKCGSHLPINTTTVIIICSQCKHMHKVSYSRLTEELSVSDFRTE